MRANTCAHSSKIVKYIYLIKLYDDDMMVIAIFRFIYAYKGTIDGSYHKYIFFREKAIYSFTTHACTLFLSKY